MKKVLRILAYFAIVFLFLGGVLLVVVDEKAGFFFVALAVLFFFLLKSSQKRAVASKASYDTAQAPVAAPVPPMTPDPTPSPVTAGTNQKCETIRVAGITNYTDEVRSLGDENPEYEYSKKEILEYGLEDEDIFEYLFDELPATFVYEPENEYDSNAIAVYVSGVKIGYVKKGSTSHIRKLIESGRLESASCEISGGKYKRLDSEDNTLEKSELNFGARITLRIKE